MSAKKTVRHIQNNFRLTTKLLSDSNILPVSKVLLKNNFPTYELPLHNPNSRPKKKRNNADCPPCPPTERDCTESDLQGQSSRWSQSSRLHPRSKWQRKQELDSSEIFGNASLDDSDYVDNTDFEDIDVERIKKNLESGKLTPQVENIISKYGNQSQENIQESINSHVLDFANKLTTEQLAYYEKTHKSKMPLDESRKMYNNYIDEGKKIIAQIDSLDEGNLQKRLHTGNKASRKLFEKYTGIKLGNTEKETQKAISDFCKVSTIKNPIPDYFDTIDFNEKIATKIDFTKNVKNQEIYSLFEKTYNQKPEKFLKQIQESVELTLVSEARYLAITYALEGAFNRIMSLYNNQPVLNVRTSDSVGKQAYSTPIPLGFLISNYLDLQNNSVYEPCAGNGSLTIAAKANNVTACEIDPIRVKHLLHLGFNVIKFSALDPATRVILLGNGKYKRIVMNPPFGSYPANQHIKINGRAITDIDQAIAIHSLQFLEPNGIAAIILGGHNLKVDKYGGYKANDQFFLNHIYRNFDVIKNIDINGDLYRKQGTSFDIRLIILINSNTKEFKHVLPFDYSDKQGQILKANTWEDLYKFLSPENIPESAVKHEDKNSEMSYDEFIELIKSQGISPYKIKVGNYVLESKRSPHSDNFYFAIRYKNGMDVRTSSDEISADEKAERIKYFGSHRTKELTALVVYEDFIKKSTNKENNESYNLDLMDRVELSLLLRNLKPKIFNDIRTHDSLNKKIGISERAYEEIQMYLLHPSKKNHKGNYSLKEMERIENTKDTAKKIINRFDNRYFYKGENNEQQSSQSNTNNSSEASRELDSKRQRERIQADERDSRDRGNQGQRIANNKGNDAKRDRNPDTQHETDEHGNRGYDSNAQGVGMPGGLDSSDTSPSVIDEEKFAKFAEFLKKAGL